tara:strand:+ start:315 stop:548 length:234 start_codon:yes stop_codon:yes gene_type:complete
MQFCKNQKTHPNKKDYLGVKTKKKKPPEIYSSKKLSLPTTKKHKAKTIQTPKKKGEKTKTKPKKSCLVTPNLYVYLK